MIQALGLLPHPSTPSPQAHAISVTANFDRTGRLELTYFLRFQPGSIRLPSPAAGTRVEGLWRHTCCEAFIAVAGEPAYREFNFSPSGDWQAYTFTTYRQGGLLEPAQGPALTCEAETDRLTLRARLPAPDLPPAGLWRLGLNAVLEDMQGNLSYWALRHAAGRPDFHHPDGFALEIAPP